MPRFTFHVSDGRGGIDDDTGIDAPDREQALAYAQGVARELMQNREAVTRLWSLDVHDDCGERVVEIPFAGIDPTLDHLTPEWRIRMVALCRDHRAVAEAVYQAALTVRESRALVARSRGRPYLAAAAGRSTIRDV